MPLRLIRRLHCSLMFEPPFMPAAAEFFTPASSSATLMPSPSAADARQRRCHADTSLRATVYEVSSPPGQTPPLILRLLPPRVTRRRAAFCRFSLLFATAAAAAQFAMPFFTPPLQPRYFACRHGMLTPPSPALLRYATMRLSLLMMLRLPPLRCLPCPLIFAPCHDAISHYFSPSPLIFRLPPARRFDCLRAADAAFRYFAASCFGGRLRRRHAMPPPYAYSHTPASTFTVSPC